MNGHVSPSLRLSSEEKRTLIDEKPKLDLAGDVVQRLWQSLPSLGGLRSTLFRIGFFLLPSFVQSRIDPRCRAGSSRLGPTAYLDGMRGLAALFVFFCHYSYSSFKISPGWGFDGEYYDFLRLPFVKLLYTGPPMVCVFFVISGYALSLKPLKMIRSRNTEGFSQTISSLAFRRAIRLFMPTAISTLLIVVLIRVGLYEWTRDVATSSAYLRRTREPHYKRFDTTAEQLADWAWGLFRFVHIWDWEPAGGLANMDVHLWTIPVEFRASMIVFMTLVATARLKTAVRLLVVCGLMVFYYRWNRWDMVLFNSGMLLAEMDLIRGAHTNPATSAAPAPGPSESHLPTVAPPAPGRRSDSLSPSSSSSSSSSSASTTTAAARRSGLRRAAWVAVSILGLYFMSQPNKGGDKTPGWVYLTSLIPEWWKGQLRYWQSAGSFLFVLAVGRLPGWQRFFNTAVVQYLGRISYALYLMHGPAQHTVGYAIQRWAWGVTGLEGDGYVRGFVLATVFVVPCVVWVADVFWRAVDAPVVKFARWVEMKCVVSD